MCASSLQTKAEIFLPFLFRTLKQFSLSLDATYVAAAAAAAAAEANL
jgi:hypothetical protein